MKFTSTHDFDFPVDKAVDVLKAGEDLFPMEELQNVSARKQISQKREGSKIFRKYEWNVHGQIPKAAQKVLRPEALTFVEETEWDDNRRAMETSIIPHYFKNVIKVTSTSAWSEAPGGGARRRIDSVVQVAIPIIGSIIEKVIVEHFKKNNDQSAELIRKRFSR